MLRISMLLPDLRGGGAERVSISLAREFERLGCNVQIVVMRYDGALLSDVKAEFDVVSLDAPKIRNLPAALLNYVRKEKPHVLLASMWPLTVISALAYFLPSVGCKVVVVEHGMLSAQYRSKGLLHRAVMRLSMALGYRLAHSRVGVSSGVVSDIAALAKMDSRYFNVIHNPVPPPSVAAGDSYNTINELWGVNPGAKIITVGSFKSVKNHALLLHAFSRILDKRPASLMILGEGELRSATEQLITELGLERSVILPGFFNDPGPFYKSADIFVLSSDNEGLPTVLIEALACGIPVVSTDCPSGPAEILENGKFGALVPVGDEVALADAIASALQRKHDPELLRARARDFAPEVAAARYLELFK